MNFNLKIFVLQMKYEWCRRFGHSKRSEVVARRMPSQGGAHYGFAVIRFEGFQCPRCRREFSMHEARGWRKK